MKSSTDVVLSMYLSYLNSTYCGSEYFNLKTTVTCVQ